MATLESVQAKIRKLEQQAEALIAKQASGVIEKIRDLMAKHNLTIGDIDARVDGKKRAKSVAANPVAKRGTSEAKYRDPKSGATWSGHGRAPKWIATAKNRDKFLIEESTAAAKPVSAINAKAAGNYVRGPQPAMYRDPKSGATWSGRGRAPTWISGAKNRSKFLISGATEITTAETTSKPKTTAKKALTTKKVANPLKGKTTSAAKKAVDVTNGLAASKTAATKKQPASLTKRPAVKKVTTKESVTDKALVASAEGTTAGDGITGVSA